MAKPTHRNDAIDKLLQDRAQFISWITRLTGPSNASPPVPDAVRHRVRADYEGRLQSVVEALRSHQNDLEQQMSEFAARRDTLSTRESEAKERLSEAEVRHMVGEYDDGRWQTIRADLTREVGQPLTPEYAAPEQLARSSITTATDIYALGLVLFVLLVGQHPGGAEASKLAGLNRSAAFGTASAFSRAAVGIVRFAVMPGFSLPSGFSTSTTAV